MHGAPSLMVLTIWMQISERKPPKGFGMQRGSQQYYNFVPCTRRRRTAGRHRIFYANFRDIFRFRPNNYYCFRDHGRIRCRKVTTGYRATGSCILYNIVYIRGKLRLARRGHSIVIELWYSAAEYVNQITYDEFGTVLGLYIYIYTLYGRVFIFIIIRAASKITFCVYITLTFIAGQKASVSFLTCDRIPPLLILGIRIKDPEIPFAERGVRCLIVIKCYSMRLLDLFYF